ncbi:MAG: hypothetical protein EXR31_08030 [Betaproteobacteria bacterium]|nr:hypothetical protein [Betaproteobacteria bacterium]
MDSASIARAAHFLLDAHAAKARFAALPADCAPATVRDAYAIQDAFVALKAARCGPPAGWKIALATPQMQRMVGVDTPIAGAMHAGRLLRAPATVRASDYGRLIVEFEIAAELGEDLPTREKPYTAQEAGDAVAALMPAFELADDRNADYAALAARGLDLIADNAWNEGVVLGARIQDWRGIDLGALRGVASINGETVGEGRGRDTMGHPLNVVAWIANNLSARGKGLRRGELVITGSLVTSKFPQTGDSVGFDAGALGTVTLAVR